MGQFVIVIIMQFFSACNFTLSGDVKVTHPLPLPLKALVQKNTANSRPLQWILLCRVLTHSLKRIVHKHNILTTKLVKLILTTK